MSPPPVLAGDTSQRPEPLGIGAEAVEGSEVLADLTATPPAVPLALATANGHQLYSARLQRPPPASSPEYPTTTTAILDPSQTLFTQHKFTNTQSQLH